MYVLQRFLCLQNTFADLARPESQASVSLTPADHREQYLIRSFVAMSHMISPLPLIGSELGHLPMDHLSRQSLDALRASHHP